MKIAFVNMKIARHESVNGKLYGSAFLTFFFQLRPMSDNYFMCYFLDPYYFGWIFGVFDIPVGSCI